MEYTEGETLRDIIDNSPDYLTRGTIFALFTQMMTALKKIHSSGLIHRDIKPENIFVNRKTNFLQVGDFGLAKSLKQTEGMSFQSKIKRNQSYQFPFALNNRVSLPSGMNEVSSRDLGGSPMYLSPEQRTFNLHRQANPPREKVDIYAAGLILFEMCGKFSTQMERCINLDNLSNKRKFPKNFETLYY